MKTVFCGCSYVEGVGLENTNANPDLWVNLIHQKFLSHTTLINLGHRGSNNEDIFLSALDSISNHCPEYIFVCWSELLRLQVNPAVELYPTAMYWGQGSTIREDLPMNPGITLSAAYIENIKNRFFDLQHPHYKIIQILNYSRILNSLCQLSNIKIFFVNSLIPVDKGYFDHVNNTQRLPTHTTPTTRKFFNSETRDDDEFFKIYDKAHKEYKDSQGLDCNWVNIDQSFRRYFYIDRGTDDLHPGVNSNKLYANFLTTKLQNWFS